MHVRNQTDSGRTAEAHAFVIEAAECGKAVRNMSSSGIEEDRSRLDGFEQEIFDLVRKHATSEQWREWLRAPLEHAAVKGNIDLFTRLMDAGADGSAGWRGCHGRTLLGAAAYGKRREMALALLQAGAKPDLDVNFGTKHESALHVAAVQGAEKVSKALPLARADPNVRNRSKESPLHLAAKKGHHVIVNNLLLRGAVPNAKSGVVMQTPLHLAASEGRTWCVSALVLGAADVDIRDTDGKTPLYLAATSNRIAVVEELLAAGANFDIRENLDWSPLERSTEKGHVSVVKALLRHGSRVDACDSNGFTALHCLPDRENGDVIRELLAAGADIEAKTTQNGLTPLYTAVSRRKTSGGAIKSLLEAGADANARTTKERTPLHKACECSNVAGVELLLRWGADETLVNQDGDTAVDDVGAWEEDDGTDEDEQRKADDQRIRHMLARAPADRSWRRRGWLVLARSCPAKVQLTQDSDGGCSGGSSAKPAKTSYGGGDRRGDETADFVRLVGSVVDLDAEGVFRLVVSFL